MRTAELVYRSGPLPDRNNYFLLPLGQEATGVWVHPRAISEPSGPPERRKVDQDYLYVKLRRWLAHPDDRDYVHGNVVVRQRCGDCHRPYVRYDHAVREPDRPVGKPNAALMATAQELVVKLSRINYSLHAYTMLRCRACTSCLRRRRRDWYERARAEAYYAISKYTKKVRGRNGASCGVWMMTFTFAPAAHAKSIDLAMDWCAARAVDFSTLKDDEKFDARLEAFYTPLFTRFIDRVRKSVGSFRYISVCELHAGEWKGGSGANLGQPHWHMLFFETDPERPLSKAGMEAAFRYDEDAGFVGAKLCRSRYRKGDNVSEEQAAAIDRDAIGRCVNYVCAYLTKSPICRIRCSERFGYPQKWDADHFATEAAAKQAEAEERRQSEPSARIAEAVKAAQGKTVVTLASPLIRPIGELVAGVCSNVIPDGHGAAFDDSG